MKSRMMLNLAMLALVLVLGLVVWLRPATKSEDRIPLLSQDTAALTRLTLQNADTLVFEKKDGLWTLTAPFAAPVNQVRLGQLLDIAKSASEARYPVRADELAQFGLDRPQATLTLGQDVLQFGGVEPLDMRRYVRVGDTLHLVNDSFFHHLTAPATDYVDKKLVPENAKIREIQLPGLRAVRGADGHWTAEPPAGKPAGNPPGNLSELASTWATARAIDVKRQDKDSRQIIGETIRITPAEGPPLEYIIIQKQPELILSRKDLGLQFIITGATSRELLNLPAPQPPATHGPSADSPDDESHEHDVEGMETDAPVSKDAGHDHDDE